MSHTSRQFTKLLKQVSRSFYLTLRILPDAIRPQIGLAYLLARATDTIADTSLVPVDRRLEALRDLKNAIAASATSIQCEALDFGELSAAQEVAGRSGFLRRTHAAGKHR